MNKWTKQSTAYGDQQTKNAIFIARTSLTALWSRLNRDRCSSPEDTDSCNWKKKHIWMYCQNIFWMLLYIDIFCSLNFKFILLNFNWIFILKLYQCKVVSIAFTIKTICFSCVSTIDEKFVLWRNNYITW